MGKCPLALPNDGRLAFVGPARWCQLAWQPPRSLARASYPLCQALLAGVVVRHEPRFRSWLSAGSNYNGFPAATGQISARQTVRGGFVSALRLKVHDCQVNSAGPLVFSSPTRTEPPAGRASDRSETGRSRQPPFLTFPIGHIERSPRLASHRIVPLVVMMNS